MDCDKRSYYPKLSLRKLLLLLPLGAFVITVPAQTPNRFFIQGSSTDTCAHPLDSATGFNRQPPVLKISLYKILGKSKKTDVRLSAFGAFNRNVGITQSASQNFVMQERIQTLSRYFMLSFTYNTRGLNTPHKHTDSFFEERLF
ncbi:MAG: hypothetical protein U0X91_32205 [Spirosomataceae bacterium]